MWRISTWVLMKRHKDSFKQRLAVGNPRAAENFDENKHYLRPISFNFLSQIDNAEEYGNNGYQYSYRLKFRLKEGICRGDMSPFFIYLCVIEQKLFKKSGTMLERKFFSLQQAILFENKGIRIVYY